MLVTADHAVRRAWSQTHASHSSAGGDVEVVVLEVHLKHRRVLTQGGPNRPSPSHTQTTQTQPLNNLPKQLSSQLAKTLGETYSK